MLSVVVMTNVDGVANTWKKITSRSPEKTVKEVVQTEKV